MGLSWRKASRPRRASFLRRDFYRPLQYVRSYISSKGMRDIERTIYLSLNCFLYRLIEDLALSPDLNHTSYLLLYIMCGASIGDSGTIRDNLISG